MSLVDIWVQAANCKLVVEMCVESDLEQFRIMKLISGMNCGFVVSNMCIDWYDIRNLYLQTV